VVKEEGSVVNMLKTHVLMNVKLLAEVRPCMYADYADLIVAVVLSCYEVTSYACR